MKREREGEKGRLGEKKAKQREAKPGTAYGFSALFLNMPSTLFGPE